MKTNFQNLLYIICSCWISNLNAQYIPIDKSATESTKVFYKNLHKQAQKGFMIGHQDDLSYGIGWRNLDGESDIKRVTGQYPAVFGWDLAHIELDSANNLDGVSFDKMKQNMKKVHAMGGVNTITWHLRNPVNGKSAWDVDTVVKHILKGGNKNAIYQSWMSKVAVFLNSLKDEKGNPIPVIFRPFHEHNGSWFWWGKKFCTPQEYKQLYQQTVQHLGSKGVHNVIYAYSTDNFPDEADYLERYPGNDFVDLIGFDTYHRNAPQSNEAFVKNLKRMLATVENYAEKNHKLLAITETGLEKVTDPNWWTNILLKGVDNHKISYVLLWRNGRPDHYYVPYPNQQSAEDFKEFVKNPKVFLGDKTMKENLYKK